MKVIICNEYDSHFQAMQIIHIEKYTGKTSISEIDGDKLDKYILQSGPWSQVFDIQKIADELGRGLEDDEENACLVLVYDNGYEIARFFKQK